MELEACVKCQNSGETNWEPTYDGDRVAPVNNIAHSLWSSMRVTLCNKVISDASPTYAYRSYLETLLGVSVATLKSQATASGFYGDLPKSFDDAENNQGEKERKSLFATNGYVQLAMRPNCDIFQQSKNLIPGVSIQLNFILNRPEF